MNLKKKENKILSPINQLNLFGYDNYFNFFINLFEKENTPNTLLLSGYKGLGKSTFVYHFSNYLLSKKEKNKYSLENFSINENNKSYKLLTSNTHPNFFLVDNKKGDKEIKIDQIRNLLKFIAKSTYSEDIKIVLIDNIENLNKSSSNSLLKAIEEPSKNTFFFLVHNNSSKILDTIKSRCIEFKFSFNTVEKKKIFERLLEAYKMHINIDEVSDHLYFDTPGNLINYFIILNDASFNLNEDAQKCILYLLEKYESSKENELLSFFLLFVEKYYRNLSNINNDRISSYFSNKSKIFNYIENMRKFNLDKKNVLILIKDIIQNEAK